MKGNKKRQTAESRSTGFNSIDQPVIRKEERKRMKEFIKKKQFKDDVSGIGFI